jgi:hypothetical protein
VKKVILYLWIIVMTVSIMIEGHGENGHRKFSFSQPDISHSPKQFPYVSTLNPMSTPGDTDRQISQAVDSAFLNTWELFVKAVKRKDTRQLKELIVFPLRGAGACYLSHDRLLDPEEDTVGITASQFDSLYSEIFDQSAMQQIEAPLSGNDPILVWHGTGRVDSLIAKESDPDTQIYSYHIEYVANNREGGKYFLFARVEGRYKLFALLCDGMFVY